MCLFGALGSLFWWYLIAPFWLFGSGARAVRSGAVSLHLCQTHVCEPTVKYTIKKHYPYIDCESVKVNRPRDYSQAGALLIAKRQNIKTYTIYTIDSVQTLHHGSPSTAVDLDTIRVLKVWAHNSHHVRLTDIYFVCYYTDETKTKDAACLLC